MASCRGSQVRLQTRRICAGLARHSRQTEERRRCDPTHPSAWGHGPVHGAQALGGVCVIPTHPSAWGVPHGPKSTGSGGSLCRRFICPPSRNVMKPLVKGEGLSEGRRELAGGGSHTGVWAAATPAPPSSRALLCAPLELPLPPHSRPESCSLAGCVLWAPVSLAGSLPPSPVPGTHSAANKCL